MTQERRNPPRVRRASECSLPGSRNNQNTTPTQTEYQAALAYLITKYGVPRARVRTVA